MADAVPEHLVAPANHTRDRLGVWIHDNFDRVETMSARGIVWAVYAITVELVRSNVWKEPVPNHVVMFGKRNAGRFFRRVGGVEKAKLDLGRMRRKEREVHTDPGPRCAQGIRLAGPDTHARLSIIFCARHGRVPG